MNSEEQKKEGRSKKVYVPPRVTTEQLHETSAVSCGKNSPISSDCIASPTTS